MSRLQELFKAAHSLGLRHGTGTAQWYFDRTEPSRQDYLRVLKGIRDGDPEILDTFNDSPLSGEFADDWTPQSLWDAIDANEQQRVVAGDEICDVFENAYRQAYSSTIEQECLTMLEREVTFHIVVNLTEHDSQEISNAIEEMLVGKQFNVGDIPDITIEDPDAE